MAKQSRQCRSESREDRIEKIAEMIRNNEYAVDPELLADAILEHLGLASDGQGGAPGGQLP